MKTKLFFISVLCIATVLIISCKSTKKLEKVNKSTELKLPLSGKEYQTNKNYFRAIQSGKSPDLSTAKKIALQNAKAEMSGNIQSTIKRVTDQYTNQRSVNNAQEFENKFEELSREVVNQELYDVKIIDDKIFKEKDNTYTYWIAIETSKENILNGINTSISKDKQIQIDFDKYQFEKIFNEEMEKFKVGQ